MDLTFARTWLRLEGLAVLVAALACFENSSLSWGVFALLFLVPDLSMLGYLAGPRVGAWSYNLVHSYTGPLLLMAWSLAGGPPVLGGYGAIWWAHLGFDRALGYGLKSPAGFHLTHLGKIGRASSP
jgi:Domain of unknown function (DUF4260)